MLQLQRLGNGARQSFLHASRYISQGIDGYDGAAQFLSRRNLHNHDLPDPELGLVLHRHDTDDLRVRHGSASRRRWKDLC
jgi:hypothetical protein